MKNVSGLTELGLPNFLTRSFSEVTSVRTPTGPQRNTPAIAPTVVDVGGTTVVRSISEILMPGLTWYPPPPEPKFCTAMLISLKRLYSLISYHIYNLVDYSVMSCSNEAVSAETSSTCVKSLSWPVSRNPKGVNSFSISCSDFSLSLSSVLMSVKSLKYC